VTFIHELLFNHHTGRWQGPLFTGPHLMQHPGK
jgi:hypothetical protein